MPRPHISQVQYQGAASHTKSLEDVVAQTETNFKERNEPREYNLELFNEGSVYDKKIGEIKDKELSRNERNKTKHNKTISKKAPSQEIKPDPYNLRENLKLYG